MATEPEKSVLNLLFSQPRSCSHLLARVLNLPARPTIYKHPGDGHFFKGILGARFTKVITHIEVAHLLCPTHGNPWLYGAASGARHYQHQKRRSSRILLTSPKMHGEHGELGEVESMGKGCFVKQHICWIIDPAAESAFIESLGPELAGRTYDFVGANAKMATLKSERSAGNETVEKRTAVDSLQFPIVLDAGDINSPELIKEYVKAVGMDDGLLR
ncbi:hypothetical protein CC78DRAFT_586680 [Lojkania enalia]|uniref:Uncharacterized protein n=1 Tax=Lojkania enalia TaxID=147567 RepID=A0A9P4JYG7_9PLEO|nr:hypothetical protein CC78DRAFT_586680 [Didymosphaeria enalia]